MKEIFKKTEAVVQTAVIFLIQCYRVAVSPHFGNCCRFYPSCSVYAQQTIRTRGVIQGTFLTLLRLLKCQPLHPGGIDVIESRT
jgi:putative membrane protein insertion efficiency factor